MDLRRYQELKSKASQLQRDVDRAIGARDKLLADLKEKFDCNSLEEGEKKYKEWTKKLDTLNKKFESKLVAFQLKWSSVFGEQS